MIRIQVESETSLIEDICQEGLTNMCQSTVNKNVWLSLDIWNLLKDIDVFMITNAIFSLNHERWAYLFSIEKCHCNSKKSFSQAINKFLYDKLDLCWSMYLRSTKKWHLNIVFCEFKKSKKECYKESKLSILLSRF